MPFELELPANLPEPVVADGRSFVELALNRLELAVILHLPHLVLDGCYLQLC
jgi:hypothetical protein